MCMYATLGYDAMVQSDYRFAQKGPDARQVWVAPSNGKRCVTPLRDHGQQSLYIFILSVEAVIKYSQAV
jgi:hypothetical protein